MKVEKNEVVEEQQENTTPQSSLNGEEKRVIKDYSKYSFGPNDVLRVNPQVLDMIRNFVNDVLGTEGVGITRVTSPRYTYMHNETGHPAKSGTKKADLEDNYTRTYDHVKTMESAPEELILPLGKKALATMEVLNFVHKENLDAGVGDTVENLKVQLEKDAADAEPVKDPVSAPLIKE